MGGALLLLAQNQPDQVPNKLYEYLGTRRTILAFVDQDGESAAMLRQVGGHYLFSGSEEAPVEEAIIRLVTRRDGPTPGDDRLLEAWTTRAQMNQLVTRIGGL